MEAVCPLTHTRRVFSLDRLQQRLPPVLKSDNYRKSHMRVMEHRLSELKFPLTWKNVSGSVLIILAPHSPTAAPLKVGSGITQGCRTLTWQRGAAVAGLLGVVYHPMQQQAIPTSSLSHP